MNRGSLAGRIAVTQDSDGRWITKWVSEPLGCLSRFTATRREMEVLLEQERRALAEQEAGSSDFMSAMLRPNSVHQSERPSA